jgi:hypothetical protein
MLHLKPTVYVILTVLLPLLANAEPFTILAKSGLNVRKEPNAKSEKVTALPFGTIVEAHAQPEKATPESIQGVHFRYGRSFHRDQYFMSTHPEELIEGKRGFWVFITHKNFEGYVFTGFGLFGEWAEQPGKINNEYRLLTLGQRRFPVNYDPALNWYGMVRKNGKLILKKTDITLRLINEYGDRDTLEDNGPPGWQNCPITVLCDLKDSVFLLVGSKKALPEGQIHSDFWETGGKRDAYNRRGKFLESGETFFICDKDDRLQQDCYAFHAFERTVAIGSNSTKQTESRYQIEMIYNGVHYNISKDIDMHAEDNHADETLFSSKERHEVYKQPLIAWVGDLNGDGLLDFIYYFHNMTDSCGVFAGYHLFMSDKNNPGKPARKVADEWTF